MAIEGFHGSSAPASAFDSQMTAPTQSVAASAPWLVSGQPSAPPVEPKIAPLPATKTPHSTGLVGATDIFIHDNRHDIRDDSLGQRLTQAKSALSLIPVVVDRARLGAAGYQAAQSEIGLIGKLGVATKYLGAAATTGAMNSLVPIRGGTATVAGATLSTQAWRTAYGVENGISGALGALQFGVGAVGTIDSIRQGGIAGPVDSREGRNGLVQTAGGAYVLKVMASAYRQDGAELGWKSLIYGKKMGTWKVAVAEMLPGLICVLNSAGVFDFMNADNKTSFGESMEDGLANVPQTAMHFFLPFL